MTSMPASRSARAMIFAPRSCPSRPGLATTTRIFLFVAVVMSGAGRLIVRPRARLAPLERDDARRARPHAALAEAVAADCPEQTAVRAGGRLLAAAEEQQVEPGARRADRDVGAAGHRAGGQVVGDRRRVRCEQRV